MMETGGYDCDLVEEAQDDLVCPICLLPSREPHLVSCCGRKMCRSCISRLQDQTDLVPFYDPPPRCPLCREQEFNTMSDKQVERRVLDLKVYCKHKDEGCTWIGELRQLEQHSLESCLYRSVSCTYDCGLLGTQIDMFIHERDTCDLRPALALQKQLDNMKKEVDSLQKKCNTKDKEKEEQRQLAVRQRNTIRELQDKLADSQAHVEVILRTNDEVNERLITCKESKEELESEIDFLKGKHSLRKKMLQQIRSKMLAVLEDPENILSDDGSDDETIAVAKTTESAIKKQADTDSEEDDKNIWHNQLEREELHHVVPTWNNERSTVSICSSNQKIDPIMQRPQPRPKQRAYFRRPKEPEVVSVNDIKPICDEKLEYWKGIEDEPTCIEVPDNEEIRLPSPIAAYTSDDDDLY